MTKTKKVAATVNFEVTTTKGENICPKFREQKVVEFVKILKKLSKKNKGNLWLKKFPLELRVIGMKHYEPMVNVSSFTKNESLREENLRLKAENECLKKKIEVTSNLVDQHDVHQNMIKNIEAANAEEIELLKSD